MAKTRRAFSTNEVLAIVGTLALIVSSIQTCQSRRQLSLAQKSLTFAQRPWVVVDTIEPNLTEWEDLDEMEVTVLWKNESQGPARDVRTFMGFVTRPPTIPLPSVWNVVPDQPSVVSVTPILGPGGIDRIIPSMKLSKHEWELINGGQRLLNLVGWATFSDVFGTEHWTTYCAFYVPKKTRFDVCDVGNDADNN